MNKPQAFVIMPFGEGFDEIDGLFTAGAVSEAGYEVVRADDIRSQQNILKDVLAGLTDSALVHGGGEGPVASIPGPTRSSRGIGATPTSIVGQANRDHAIDGAGRANLQQGCRCGSSQPGGVRSECRPNTLDDRSRQRTDAKPIVRVRLTKICSRRWRGQRIGPI